MRNRTKLDPLLPLDPNAFYTAKYLARRWGMRPNHHFQMGCSRRLAAADQARPEHIALARLRYRSA